MRRAAPGAGAKRSATDKHAPYCSKTGNKKGASAPFLFTIHSMTLSAYGHSSRQNVRDHHGRDHDHRAHDRAPALLR